MTGKIKEELAFSSMMIFGMVTIMLAYNSILIAGFSFVAFKMVLSQFIPIFTAVFIIEHLFVGYNVQKLHKILVSPDDSGFKREMVMVVLMVTAMCAAMAMYTTLIYVGTDGGFWQHYLLAVARNYPVALFSQIAIVGPLVRILHKKVFLRTTMLD